MFLKKLWNRMLELLSDKSSGIQPEFRQQLEDIAKRIEELLKDKHGECDIPDDLIKEIARCLAPILEHSSKLKKQARVRGMESRAREKDS